MQRYGANSSVTGLLYSICLAYWATLSVVSQILSSRDKEQHVCLHWCFHFALKYWTFTYWRNFPAKLNFQDSPLKTTTKVQGTEGCNSCRFGNIKCMCRICKKFCMRDLWRKQYLYLLYLRNWMLVTRFPSCSCPAITASDSRVSGSCSQLCHW